MTRRRKAKNTPTGPSLAQALQDGAVKVFGQGDVPDVAGEVFESIYGLYLKGCLPLQYIIGVDVLPLSRSMSVVGPPGSMKSVVSWFIAKLFLESKGLVVFLEAEHKSNWDQFRGVVGNDELIASNVIVQKIRTLDGMLAAMVKYTQLYNEICPDKSVPLLIMIDSVSAVTSESNVKEMEKNLRTGDGYAAAHNAKAITEQFRAFVPNHIADNPITLLLINQEKESMEQPVSSFMPKKKSEPGGIHKDFAASLTIAMSKGRDTSTKEFDRVGFNMKTKKSSFSRTGKKIQSDMTTCTTETDDLEVDFNWDECLVSILLDDKIMLKSVQKEICGVVKNGSSYNCLKLGLKDVSAAEVGAAIHNNPEMVEKLRRALRIRKKRKFGEQPSEEVSAGAEEEPDVVEGAQA
jgi:hypothetical protein